MQEQSFQDVFNELSNLCRKVPKKKIVFKKGFSYSTYNRARSYIKRNMFLKRMGYLTYSQYLESKLWQSIRTRVLLKINYCVFCMSKHRLQVHHLLYSKKNLSGKTINNLITVCNNCHSDISELERQRSLKPEGATREYARICNISWKDIAKLAN